MNASDSQEVREFKERYPQYFIAKRATAIQEVQKDRAKTDDELLVDIHDESLASLEERPAHETIVRTVARFAALVSNVSV